MNFGPRKALFVALALIAISPVMTSSHWLTAQSVEPTEVVRRGKLWQGRVVRTHGADLTVKVGDSTHTFEVADDAIVKKDRRSVSIDALSSGDFVNVRSAANNHQLAISVQAYSLR